MTDPNDEGTDGGFPSLDDFPSCGALESSRPGHLGRRRRVMILIIAAIGLATFASPFVRTDSAVLGRSTWSPLQIAIEIYRGTLPACSSDALSICVEGRSRLVDDCLEAALGCGSAYALLLVIAAAALLLPRAALVICSAALGITVLLGGPKFNYPDFQGLLYGAPFSFGGHRIHAGILYLILASVFGLLAWIAVTTALDY